MHLPNSLIQTLITLALFTTIIHAQTISFTDVTEFVGIPKRNLNKWGGPCIADLDNDGVYDMILSYHFSAPLEIYWGNPNGTFEKDPFFFKGDIHGINVGFRTAHSQQRLLAVNVGGGRGAKLKPPFMFLINPDRTIVEVTNEFGLGVGVGRGRVALFMDLSLRNNTQRNTAYGGPDLTVLGFVDRDDGILQHGYQNFRGNYTFKMLPGFETERDGRIALVDLDNDRRMEILSFPDAQIYKLIAPFTFEDVTESFFAPLFPSRARTVSSVAEFDMNNDDKFDLYLARSIRSDISKSNKTGLPFFDILFKNSADGLVDVSSPAAIPNDTRSVGVTSADFDNNGFVDLFVSVFEGQDFFLMNNGDETFTRVDGIITRDEGVSGDHAVAVDYDQDGRVDLIVGQGTKKEFSGPFLVMRNTLPLAEKTHYLLVRVGHHPGRYSTSLHAVVTVFVGRMKMVRRVGSPGTQSGGPSLLDTVHFGLGSFDVVDRMRVQWVAGGEMVMSNVTANQKVVFGIVD